MHNLPVLPFRELQRKVVRAGDWRFPIRIHLDKVRLLRRGRHDWKKEKQRSEVGSTSEAPGEGRIDLEISSFETSINRQRVP
jgi:hypothetical protein